MGDERQTIGGAKLIRMADQSEPMELTGSWSNSVVKWQQAASFNNGYQELFLICIAEMTKMLSEGSIPA